MDFELDHPQAGLEDAVPQDKNKEEENEFSPLELNLPGKPGAASREASHPAPAEFDLSGISLELEPAAADGAELQDVPVLGEHNYSNAAEMATKLDLASAYQEIGDREGARELLEEVIKGGTAEQSDKAKGLLQKLD
jgi:pilus assembly protein FimV